MENFFSRVLDVDDTGDEHDGVTDSRISEMSVQNSTEPLIDRALRVIENAPDGLTFSEIMRGVGIEKEQPDFESKIWELDAVIEDQLGPGGKIYGSAQGGIYRAMDTGKFKSDLLSEIYEQGAVNAEALAHTFHSSEAVVNAACESLMDAGTLTICNGDKYRLAEMREDDAKILTFITKNENVNWQKLYDNFEYNFDTPGMNLLRLEAMGEIVNQDGYFLAKDIPARDMEQDKAFEQGKVSKTSQSVQDIKDSATVGKPNMADVIKLESQAVQVETVTALQEQEQGVPALDTSDLKAAATDMRIAAQDARTVNNLRNVATTSHTTLTEKENEKKAEHINTEEDGETLKKSVETNIEKTRSVSTTKFNENDIVAYRFNDSTLGVRIGRFKGAVVKTSANGQERTGINLASDGRTVFYDDAHGVAEPATEQEKDKFNMLGRTQDRNKSRDRDRERGRGSQGR